MKLSSNGCVCTSIFVYRSCLKSGAARSLKHILNKESNSKAKSDLPLSVPVQSRGPSFFSVAPPNRDVFPLPWKGSGFTPITSRILSIISFVRYYIGKLRYF